MQIEDISKPALEACLVQEYPDLIADNNYKKDTIEYFSSRDLRKEAIHFLDEIRLGYSPQMMPLQKPRKVGTYDRRKKLFTYSDNQRLN